MILDYSDYITNKGEKGIVNYEVRDTNSELFKHDSYCPFCKQKISNAVHQKSKTDYPDWLNGSFYQNEMVYQCPICGWWEYCYHNSSDAIIDGIRAQDVEYCSAILKTYKDNDVNAPISALRDYITKKPEIIYNIDPHKMEDLVRSVFSDFYKSCKVIAVARTRDGGKDAILVDSEGSQIFVQVKRRSNADSTEGVGVLRELIGASVIQDGLKGCIFVSTADHYSKPAIAYSKQCIQKHIVESFDLIDCEGFLKMTNLVVEEAPKLWEQLIKLH